MQLNHYPPAARLIHNAYLGNYFVSKTSFDIEQLIFGKKAGAVHLKEVVFVTGLARSGTTALFNHLYNTNTFASLAYANMPFLLMPHLGAGCSRVAASQLMERAHGDGIVINNKSPEAFDEYFWKVFLGDSYIEKDTLLVHAVEKPVMENYHKYIQLTAHSYGKSSYISKNNNNILRINALLNAFPGARFIVLYRNPLQQAQSLLNQHIHFSKLQRQDHFIVDYFNYLGHHEFGLNHKPFNFHPEQKMVAGPKDLNYWLNRWKDYYGYLLKQYNGRLCLVAFEDLCESPGKVAGYLNQLMQLDQPVTIAENYSPPKVQIDGYDERILNDCLKIYDELDTKRTYI